MTRASEHQSPMEKAYHRAAGVRNQYEEFLREKANVVGVGVGLQMKGGKPTGEIAIVVLVREKVPADQLAPEDVLPAQLEGVPIDVHEIGEITAYP